MKNKCKVPRMIAIIPAAGMGSRLGKFLPKALVEVGGKPIIQHQLEALEDYDEVRLVVGYKADDVAFLAMRCNPKVKIFWNENYVHTTVVDSVMIGAKDLNPDELVTVIDGDVLFKRAQINQMGSNKYMSIAARESRSAEPVLLVTTGYHVYGFARNLIYGMEWGCICRAYPRIFNPGDKYIYNALQRHCPLPYVKLDTVEVDTHSDLAEAEEWIKRQTIK